LTVVLISLILLFALWSTVYRTTSSLLRVETTRVLHQARDQGAMTALAQALQLLQYSKPFDASNPARTQFMYGISVTVTSASGGCQSSSYVVEYSALPDQDPNRWQIQIAPGSYSVPLPMPGTNPQWP
jgi:hypothetical protein